MKLTSRVAAVQPSDDRTQGHHDWTCRACGTGCKGAWSHCSGCHLTFASLRDFDKHRTGKYQNRAIGQENTRRCFTRDELSAAGWTEDGPLLRSPVKAKAAS